VIGAWTLNLVLKETPLVVTMLLEDQLFALEILAVTELLVENVLNSVSVVGVLCMEFAQMNLASCVKMDMLRILLIVILEKQLRRMMMIIPKTEK